MYNNLEASYLLMNRVFVLTKPSILYCVPSILASNNTMCVKKSYFCAAAVACNSWDLSTWLSWEEEGNELSSKMAEPVAAAARRHTRRRHASVVMMATLLGKGAPWLYSPILRRRHVRRRVCVCKKWTNSSWLSLPLLKIISCENHPSRYREVECTTAAQLKIQNQEKKNLLYIRDFC